VTFFEVPKNGDTRTAKAKGAFARSRGVTGEAFFFSAVGEVFPVNFAMAAYAKGYSVRDNEAQMRVVCEAFDVVGMEFSAGSAALPAGIVVSLVDGIAPGVVFVGRSRPGSFEGLSALPCVGTAARSAFCRTRTRTKNLPAFIGGKGLAAYGADLGVGRVSSIPACTGTIPALAGTVGFYLVRPPADGADLFDLCIFHSCIIPQSQNKRNYCAVGKGHESA